MTSRQDLTAELDALAAAALGQPPALGPVPTGGDERTVEVYLQAARGVTDVDRFPPGETRMLGVKRVVMRLGQLFLHRQAHYNTSMAQAVTHLNEQLASMRARIGVESSRVNASVASLDTALDALEQRLNRFDDRVGAVDAAARSLHERIDVELADRINELTEAQHAVRASAAVLRSDLDRIINDIRTTTPPQVTDDTVDALGTAAGRRADEFYERFEDRMRGSDDAVRTLLEPYLVDLDARRAVGGRVYDVGCGRGEWLELLRAKGIDATGIDTNEDAVASCRERGLDVVLGDALRYLRELPAESALAVTGFHIVEHLPSELQIELVEVALRVLRPGGLLILETPNPTNLNVGAASFYLDPSHLRPVNPAYLAFLYEDVGFVGVETRFLHPREGYETGTGDARPQLDDEVMWAIRGPQDFAVLGRKPGAAPLPPS